MYKAPFEELWIWRESHKLMLEVHSICNELPYSEKVLVGQAKRSSSSVPDNIAESYGEFYYKGKLKSAYVSRKEARETQNHVINLQAKGFINLEKRSELVGRYEKVVMGINNYINYLNKKNKQKD